jgi:hypothetical protein
LNHIRQLMQPLTAALPNGAALIEGHENTIAALRSLSSLWQFGEVQQVLLGR